MNKLDGNSMNIVNENIEKLKEIFPEVFSENKIDFEKLQEELGEFVDDKSERYNFTWNGKAESKKIALTPSTGTLRPCKEESKNFDETQNLYIEGDNLEVLKLLQKSYHKKVKMIYIDPPYNTGKDFVYKDNFKDNIKNYLEVTGQVDSEGNRLSTNSDISGRYHSDWLNMMYPRLKLARNLLKEDGIIFISIDDNEISNLRKLCDEIFGEDNCINKKNFIWHIPDGTNKGFIARAHEYIVAYAKNINNLKPFNRPLSLSNESIKHLTNAPGPKNNVSIIKFKKGLPFEGTDAVISGIVGGEKEPIEVIGEMIFKDGMLLEDVELKSSWRNKAQIEAFLRGEVSLDEKGQEITDVFFAKNGKPWYKKQLKYYSPKSVQKFSYEKFETTLKETLFFSNPKPVSMIKELSTLLVEKNDLVLDFFSGSGTTAHSLMKLNSEDDGNRKYICVQLPEETDIKSESNKVGYKNICEIGKERIRRAGEKILEESDKDLSKLDIGFKVLKLDSSNIKTWDSDYENLEQNLLDSVDNIKSDRTNEDLLYEILLKYGLDLTLPIEELNINDKKVFNIGFGALIVCLDSDIDTNTVEQIAELKKQYEEDYGLEDMKVVFKDNGFKDAVVKTNSLQILKQYNINEAVSI